MLRHVLILPSLAYRRKRAEAEDRTRFAPLSSPVTLGSRQDPFQASSRCRSSPFASHAARTTPPWRQPDRQAVSSPPTSSAAPTAPTGKRERPASSQAGSPAPAPVHPGPGKRQSPGEPPSRRYEDEMNGGPYDLPLAARTRSPWPPARPRIRFLSFAISPPNCALPGCVTRTSAAGVLVPFLS
jgi:hypothetical protein